MVVTPVKKTGKMAPLIIDRYFRVLEVPPLCTRREMCMMNPKECEKLIHPRLVHTAPQTRMTRRPIMGPDRLRIITFNTENPPKLSRLYKETNFKPYVEQVFVKLNKLGHGSFGNVMCMRSRENNKLYAVKCSHVPYKSGSHRNEKLREVRFLEELQHPNIVKLSSAWEEGDLLYMQTELCEQSLQMYIFEKDGNVPEFEVWACLIDMLQAVGFIHSKNIVHVDIKPDNILINDKMIFKLGDFGMAVDLMNDNADQMSREGDAKYLAFEALNAPRVTKKMDIFSLGLSMLQLGTDLWVPSSGARWKDIRELNIAQELIKNLSSELRATLFMMMSKDPSARPEVDTIVKMPVIVSHALTRRKLFHCI